MIQPDEDANEYRKEVLRWRRLWGYTPSQEQVMIILAEKRFRPAINGMVRRIADACNVGSQNSKSNHATIHHS